MVEKWDSVLGPRDPQDLQDLWTSGSQGILKAQDPKSYGTPRPSEPGTSGPFGNSLYHLNFRA